MIICPELLKLLNCMIPCILVGKVWNCGFSGSVATHTIEQENVSRVQIVKLWRRCAASPFLLDLTRRASVSDRNGFGFAFWCLHTWFVWMFYFVLWLSSTMFLEEDITFKFDIANVSNDTQQDKYNNHATLVLSGWKRSFYKFTIHSIIVSGQWWLLAFLWIWERTNHHHGRTHDRQLQYFTQILCRSNRLLKFDFV